MRRRRIIRPLVACALIGAAPFVACAAKDTTAPIAEDGGTDAPVRRRDAGRDTRGNEPSDDASDDASSEATSEASGVNDASGDAAICKPSSAAYVPTWRPPAARTAACASSEIESFWTSCW